MNTLEELSTFAFVLLKVLVATAPRKKHGYASHEPLPALPGTPSDYQATQNKALGGQKASGLLSTGHEGTATGCMIRSRFLH
jgi:hypothetical protein